MRQYSMEQTLGLSIIKLGYHANFWLGIAIIYPTFIKSVKIYSVRSLYMLGI